MNWVYGLMDWKRHLLHLTKTPAVVSDLHLVWKPYLAAEMFEVQLYCLHINIDI